MTLLQKQKAFPKLLITLFDYCIDHGYELTLGEAYRPKETAELYERQGRGISNSLHRCRLAIDINLFKDGAFLTKTEDYKLIGEFWEGMSTDLLTLCWGGRFHDGNHFSISHGGVK